eukprot:6077315-Alexandrium_andersonii.AAC.1
MVLLLGPCAMQLASSLSLKTLSVKVGWATYRLEGFLRFACPAPFLHSSSEGRGRTCSSWGRCCRRRIVQRGITSMRSLSESCSLCSIGRRRIGSGKP